MALDRFEVRISIQKVLLGLVLVIVPLSIVGLYLTSRSDSALDASIGTSLKDMAHMYSTETSHLLNDRVAAVKLIAADPGVVEAAVASNSSYAKQSGASANENIQKIEKIWSAPEGVAKVNALLSSKPSETLRHYHEMDKGMLNITVADLHGVPVAATVKPGRYNLSNWDPWQAGYASGKGEVSVGNILYDEPTKSYFVNVSVPVKGPKTEQLAGIAVASVDISPILANFQQESRDSGLQAFLVNSNGAVISGPKTDVFARAHSDAFDYVNDALASADARQTGYVLADLSHGTEIVGFADTGLQKLYKNFDWTVLVSRNEHEATAPIRMLSQFAILMVVLALFMLTLLSVYYALHRKQQFADIQEELGIPKPLSPTPPPHAV
jgi:hypothetical protein